ncbi:CHAT domain-containing protein [candidate division KSB1 bacterium]|nr:CHAT domain-containing protein [candidate division KSB1 bacterium]
MQRYKWGIATIGLLLACSTPGLGPKQVVKDVPVTGRAAASYDMSTQVVQLTTHPDIDLMPAVSPDGQWLAFASRRSGNLDIWVKRVRGGRAKQITTHPADDSQPVWDPDGKAIVFVSQRDDAMGDLWQVKLVIQYEQVVSISKPKRLTSYLGPDDSPAMSPEGKRIAFTSDRDGQRNVWIYQTSSKRVYQITRAGGMQPAWSPDGRHLTFISFRTGYMNGGDLFTVPIPDKLHEATVHDDAAQCIARTPAWEAFPCWSPVDSSIFFTRYRVDSNHDGLITSDDLGEIWRYSFADSLMMQITPSGHYQYMPFAGRDGRLYFISDQSGNPDVWDMDAIGPIPRQENAFMQYQFAALYFPLPEKYRILQADTTLTDPNFLPYRELAFDRVMDFFPTEQGFHGLSQLEIARTRVAMRDYPQAAQLFDSILHKYKDDVSVLADAHWERLHLYAITHTQTDTTLHYLMHQCDSLRTAYGSYFTTFGARLTLALGEISSATNNDVQALNYYQQVMKQYKNERTYGAIAQTRIARILRTFGQTDEVINAYLNVLQTYPEQTEWADASMDQVLDMIGETDEQSVVAEYRNISFRYPNYPRLAARAQYRIGKVLLEQGDYINAIRELEVVGTRYPDQGVETAEASLLIAEVQVQKGDDVQGIYQLKSVIDNFGHVQSGLYVVRAKQRLLDLYLTSARRLRTDADWNLALSRYRNALTIQPRNLDAIRGMLFCQSRLGRIDDGIAYFEQAIQQRPDDEVSRYALGLAYSYKATEESERLGTKSALRPGMLKKSNQYIEEALAQNYQLLPAYLALSFNYEVIEQYEDYMRSRPRSIWARSWSQVSAPLRTVFYTITFRKEPPPEQWYEKAIDVLQTAISLNDETTNPQLESELALNLAQNYYNLQEFGYARAYQFYKVKMRYDSTFVSPNARAEIYKRMGHCALVTEDYANGAVYLKRAIELYRQLNNEQEMLLNIKRLALLYQSSGDNDLAIEYFRMGIDIDKRYNRWQEVESAYRSIAYNYQLLHDEDEAIRYAQAAVRLLTGDRVQKVEAPANWITISILGITIPVWDLGTIGAGESSATEGFTTEEEMALVYSILADAYIQQKNYEKAIEYYEKKLAIYTERKDFTAQAIFHNNIGYLYYLSRNYQQAWNRYRLSLKLCDEHELVPGYLSNAINIAAIGVMIQKYPDVNIDAAPAYYSQESANIINKALALSNDLADQYARERMQFYLLAGNLAYHGKPIANDTSLSPLGELIVQFSQQLDQLERAASFYQLALEAGANHSFYHEQATVQLNLGYVAFSSGEMQTAWQSFSRCRAQAIQHNLNDLLWRSTFAMADVLADLPADNQLVQQAGKPVQQFYLDAIRLLEQNTVRVEQVVPTAVYQMDVRDVYERAIEYCVDRDSVLALQLTERMRAKQYLDVFNSHKVDMKKERHKNFLGLARDDNRRIAEAEDRIRVAQQNPDTTPKQLAELEAERQRYINEHEKLIVDIRDEDPELESLVHIQPVALADMQYILGEQYVAISYIVTPEQTYVWVIDGNALHALRLSLTQQQIQTQVNEFLLAAQANSTLLPAMADSLIKQLVVPAFAYVGNASRIIIIPDDMLSFLPFQAMMIESGSLASQPIIMVSPSLSFYYQSYHKRTISRDDVALVNTSRLEDPLLDAGYTVSVIADSSTMKSQVTAPGIVHWNTRIRWNANDMMRTTLQGTRKDGELAEKDIYLWDVRSQMLVLSGYVFDLYPSDLHLASLDHALLYAGAPTLLVPMWNTDVLENRPFFIQFYQHALEVPPAHALRQTQLAMLEQGIPFSQWGAYQLIGYSGMTEAEEEQFAQDQLNRQVRLGYVSAQEGDWGEAIADYEQALTMAQTVGNQQYVTSLKQEILTAAVNGKQFDTAMNYQEQLLNEAVAQENVSAMVQGYRAMVYMATQNKQYDTAIYYQQQYIDFMLKKQQYNEVANAIHQLGLIYEYAKQPEQAIEQYSRAMQAFTQLGDDLGLARCLRDRGRVRMTNLDQYVAAVDDQNRGLALFQQEGDDQATVAVLQEMGLSYEKMGDYKNALHYQQQGLERAQYLAEMPMIALSYQYLANVKWKLGDFQEALRYQNLALEQFEQSGNTKLRLVGLSTLGLIHMSLGSIDAGLDAERTALQLAIDINDLADQATIHKNIGLLLIEKNQWADARTEFMQSLQIDQQLDARRGLAYDYRDIGSLLIEMNQPDSALTYIDQGLAISKEILDRRNEAHCYYELGRAQFKLARFQPSLHALAQAESLATYLLTPDIQWRAIRMRAQLYERLRQPDRAEQSYRKAVAIIEEMRARIKVEEFKSGFMDSKLDVYNDLVNLLLRTNKHAAALDIVERAKSRNFLDMLANRDIHFGGNSSPELLAQGKALQDTISTLQTQIQQLRAGMTSTNADIARQIQGLELNLENARKRYADYLIEVKSQNAELADVISVEPRPISDIQAMLPPRTAMVEYYITPSVLTAWLVKHDDIQSTTQEINATQLQKIVEDFRTGISRQYSIEPLAQQLYQYTLEPLEKWLGDVDHIVFIPHHALHYVPFAALQDKDGHYVIDKFTMSLAPSATVLAFCLEKDRHYTTNASAEQVLALGNPTLANPAMALPFAEKEIESLELTYPHVAAYLQTEATETLFKQTSNTADVILLSCHGEFDDRNPLFSALLLAADNSNDGRLEAHEIFELKLHTSIVAMSACETGLSKVSSGDEVIGLTRSFMYAGSASLLSSLWKVDDLATAVMMKRFFRYLEPVDVSKAAALRKAQLIVKDEINPHPAYWAAFNVSGAW